VAFLSGAGGAATTAAIVDHFREAVPPHRMALFKQLLRQVSECLVCLSASLIPGRLARRQLLQYTNRPGLIDLSICVRRSRRYGGAAEGESGC
jgi:hypothetical protein